MPQRQVDVAIIGAGTAGLSAYSAARTYTDKLMLIERGPTGTTCARVGCMPSKALIAAADAAERARRCGEFGVKIGGGVVVDSAEVLARVRSLRDRFVAQVDETLDGYPDRAVVRGQARFTGPNSLQVGDMTVEAKAVVVATGSAPFTPPILEGLGDRLITSDDVFELERLPRRIAVFGAGAVGLEFAHALHRLGVEVCLFGVGGDVAGLTDPKVTECARRSAKKRFLFEPDSKVQSVLRDGEEVRIERLDAEGARKTTRHDLVLAATGRRPNPADLDLDAAGLPLTSKGLPEINPATLQCGDAPVFFAGDVNGARPILHESAFEGRLAGTNAATYPHLKGRPRQTRLAIVFADPELAMLGESWRELEAGRRDFVVGEADFSKQGRALILGRAEGLLRVYADPDTGRFLGAEMAAPAAEHLAHLLSWAAGEGALVSDMLERPYYHPVLEEAVRTALGNASKAMALGRPARPGDLDCGPGG